MDSSYLFNLTDTYVIDSTHKGNKARFFNHSDKPNCEARVKYVLGDYRIGFYALNDIRSQQELFFNYGHVFVDKRTVNVP